MTDKKPITIIDDYIETFPAEIQIILEKVRQTIHKAIPEAIGTIKYGMPTYDLNDGHLVFFAGWKEYISLYPTPVGDKVFQQKIAKYKKEKSTLRFPLNKPIPYDIIEQTVSFLAKEHVGKKY